MRILPSKSQGALAGWVHLQKYSSQLNDRPNAQLSLTTREARLYWCATWTLRPEDIKSHRTAHRKRSLRAVDFRRFAVGKRPAQRCARDDRMRACRDDHPHASTSVRGGPCPARRNLSPNAHHDRMVAPVRAGEDWWTVEARMVRLQENLRALGSTPQ